MAIVYKITNKLNQKPYIGWTKKSLDERWNQHKRAALRHQGNRKFYNAIKKYGTDAWSLEIIQENLKPTEAKQKEMEFIETFNSYIDGYNSTLGGDGNNGIVMSEESNERRSIALKGIPKDYLRMHGKKHSEESKNKISASHIGMKKPWVKWNKDQITKRAMTRRAITKEQYDILHDRKSQKIPYKQIANETGLTLDMVKKWAKRDWKL